MKRFVSWAAVSSLPQAKKISLDDQLQVNRAHVARHDGVLVEELVVPGESRSIVLFEDAARKIPAYARLKELIDAGAFDVLIYLDRSRLGRKASLSMAVVELCHEAGILTYETENPPAALDDVRTSYDDMLLGAIKSVGAQREVQKIQERQEMGMIARIQRGGLPGGAWFGYIQRYDPGTGRRFVELDPPAAAVVRQMFAWYLAGMGAPVIAQRLNAQGVPTPTGKLWQPVNVRSVINRVWRYAGYGEMNRLSKKRPYVRARGAWEPLLDEETAQQVVHEIAARVANRRLPNTPYLLSGVVYCRLCNRRLRVETTVRQRTTRRIQMQLSCAGGHPKAYTSYHRVLLAVRAAIELLSQPASLAALADDWEDPVQDLARQQALNAAALDKLRAALHRADDAFVAGAMDGERYKRQVDRLQVQSQQHEAEMGRIQHLIDDEKARGSRRQRLEEVAAVGLAMLDHPDVALANAWLRRHIRVWVEHNRVVEIEYL